jgi:arsenate reductase
MNLKDKSLTEEDYKKYILEHYTFLSRPVFVINNGVYVMEPNKTCLKSADYNV